MSMNIAAINTLGDSFNYFFSLLTFVTDRGIEGLGKEGRQYMNMWKLCLNYMVSPKRGSVTY